MKRTATEVSPSNIAIKKYWGKYENQIHANPSISYTLSQCRTITELEFAEGENFSVKLFLSGKEEPKFAEKTAKYLAGIEKYLPWVLRGSFVIKTENTFPHSSGIASSASGFGALAKCLMALDKEISGEKSSEENHQNASLLARLGSGSACRSLYNGLVVWGATPVVSGSADEYAVPYPVSEIHPIFRDFNDWVMLIHEGQKSVSSTVGHGLMNGNPYAQVRFAEAAKNFFTLQEILKNGDMDGFIKLVEHEALTLHAMMMVSDPAFILMQTGTLETIHKVWDFRMETGLPLFFTLDAGANVHLLFPNDGQQERIKAFIETELLAYTQSGGVVKDFMKF